MNFYEVWVRSNQYHGSDGLTYSSSENLSPGQLVKVPLRNELVSGIVVKIAAKPKMATKNIDTIFDLPTIPEKLMQLMHWLKAYYPAPLGIISQQFIPNGLRNETVEVQDHTPINTSSLPALTSEQRQAYETINHPDTYILHGRTGSGKTRIYLELVKDTFEAGKSAIVLTPEISLTTQLEQNFRQLFGDRVIVLHSTLTPKQRLERWLRILHSDQPVVVIGPRSALFSPLKEIGTIIIDEEHEPAYKQEQAPYYLTSRVAAQLRNLHEARLILGSATPLVSDYYMAESLNKPILRLSSLAQTNDYSLKTEIVDCKDRSLFNRSSYFSQPLIEAIEEALQENSQVLLYLNRRGTARVIICEQCDWQAHCPRCDLPLTYHGDKHHLRCHVCGHIASAPVSCPKCKNPSIKYLSIGTKAVVNETEKLFPNAIVRRFDADNAKADRLEQNYQELKDGGFDIIVGTQMLAKGLDLPKLSVVGVMLADTSLQMPDYTANERTFQLLEQVVGRVGRGHIAGKAIVQTYQPDSPVIKAALEDDWDSFYQRELIERRSFYFPPFLHLLKLTVQKASSLSAQKAAIKLVESLPKELRIDGPAPALHEKYGNKFRWQLVVKSTKRSDLIKIVKQLPAGWSYDLDPMDLM